jgi:hypothetical protein
LNITGSMGTNGTSVAVTGPTGPTGPSGERGYRGKSIFLLSGSWNTGMCGGPPAICYGGFLFENVGPNVGECGSSQGSDTYYSNGELTGSLVPPVANGLILYTDVLCTSVASNLSVHNGSTILYTDGAGVISSIGCSS